MCYILFSAESLLISQYVFVQICLNTKFKRLHKHYTSDESYHQYTQLQDKVISCQISYRLKPSIELGKGGDRVNFSNITLSKQSRRELN